VPWHALPLLAMLAGCAANPDQSVYVMSAPIGAPGGTLTAPGRLQLEVRPVRLPDYLDTTDLVTRSGQYGIEASRTGRWGERLSKGVTRSLAADLGQILQASIVADRPDVLIEVTVSAFDVTAATSMLEASWTLAWQGDGRPPRDHHGRFSAGMAPSGGDMAVVAGMADSVAALSGGIAATLRADAAQAGHGDPASAPTRPR